jgi:hypothetical protein
MLQYIGMAIFEVGICFLSFINMMLTRPAFKLVTHIDPYHAILIPLPFNKYQSWSWSAKALGNTPSPKDSMPLKYLRHEY